MAEFEPMQQAGTGIPFNLTELPAARIETHRKLGFWITAFAAPFCAAAIAGCIFAAKQGAPVIAGIGSLFFLVLLAILLYGINCLMTKVIVRIDSGFVHQQEIAFWKHGEWHEPFDCYQLQIKILTSRGQGDEHHAGRLNHSFHIRLAHRNDLRSIELFETESADQLRDQFRLYQTQLRVNEDPHVRDFNTDRPIKDLDTYGLPCDWQDATGLADRGNKERRH